MSFLYFSFCFSKKSNLPCHKAFSFSNSVCKSQCWRSISWNLALHSSTSSLIPRSPLASASFNSSIYSYKRWFSTSRLLISSFYWRSRFSCFSFKTAVSLSFWLTVYCISFSRSFIALRFCSYFLSTLSFSDWIRAILSYKVF